LSDVSFTIDIFLGVELTRTSLGCQKTNERWFSFVEQRNLQHEKEINLIINKAHLKLDLE